LWLVQGARTTERLVPFGERSDRGERMRDCPKVRSASTATVLITPLGSKPQLTTIALDLLQERG
jgi:hypothetical protein